MDRKSQRPAIERAVEAVAALSLGGAVGFGVVRLAPVAGTPLWAIAALCAIGSAFAALALLGRVGSIGPPDLPAFEPVAFEDDELLLDDPIAPLAPDSRVVRLFQREQPEPLPEPGELVVRIADYLETGRGDRAPAEDEPARPDANAALHAALADIRRSLRQ